MKKVINDEDIRKLNNVERCKYLIKIIKGEVIYTQDLKTRRKQ